MRFITSIKESTDAAIAQFIPNEPQFLKAYKKLEAEYLKTPVLFAGAHDVLQAIVASGGRNFLVSHRNKQVLDILEKTNLLSYFTEVCHFRKWLFYVNRVQNRCCI